jgi:hypothetical protein
MIRKSGHRFSEKIMLKQEAKARWQMPLRFGPFAVQQKACLVMSR